MTPQDIRIGTRFEFEMYNENGEKVGHTFVSQLLEHQTDGMMVISAPITESRVVFVPIGISVHLTFIHNLHGLLGFTAIVKAREYRGNIAILLIQPDEGIEKIQRREHYRLDIILDVLIWPAEAALEEAAAIDQDQTETAASAASGYDSAVRAYTRNLSGSGICIISEKSFPRNTMIRIELDLADKVKINANCVVLRSQPVEIKKGRSYELGVRFTEISKKDQDNLIKFIFEQQRMLLKKEK